MTQRNQSLLLALLWALALAFVLLAVLAGVRNYSPVPFGDMWPGNLAFYTQIGDGKLEHWWGQHNEHRILLSRLLFWFDLAVLRGTTPFLQVVNYLLALALWAAMCKLAARSMAAVGSPTLTRYLAPLLLTICFSLMQYENFYWGFQSQFFLVHLLPLCAFYCLSRASEREGQGWFWAACTLGVLSAGTMANGVLALPVMVLQACLLRMRWWRLVILIALSIIVPLAYFHGYTSPYGHGSLSDALVNHPDDLTRYVLLYLGSPFHRLAGNNPQLAKVMGAFLVASAAFFLWRALFARNKPTYQAALLALLLFIGGTAVGTGGGRLVFGLEQALSNRYTTPALLAWAALLILYVQLSAPIFERRPRLLLLSLALPIGMLPVQLYYQSHNHLPEAFEGKLAVLAMQMQMQDQGTLNTVANNVPRALLSAVAKDMTTQSLSVFALPEMQRAAVPLGWTDSSEPAPACHGFLDTIEAVDGDERYVWIRGWLVDGASQQVPESLHVVDASGKVVGYALIGKERSDVAKALSRSAQYSGFAGYVLRSAAAGPLTLRAQAPDCQLQVNP